MNFGLTACWELHKKAGSSGQPMMMLLLLGRYSAGPGQSPDLIGGGTSACAIKDRAIAAARVQVQEQEACMVAARRDE